MTNTPEINTTPPDDGAYVMADCGHEVYEGETLTYWKNAKGKVVTLCPDCFMDRVREMSIAEVAALMGCTYETVGADA